VHNDLRSWLQEVDQHGELKRISGASCDLEMASISEIINSRPDKVKPAILFEDIPGYAKNYTALFGVLGSFWRVAKSLGLPEDETNRMNLLRAWHHKVGGLRMLPPKVVTSAPILENVDAGDKIDLLKFPVPLFHELDGGRYIGTCHAVINRDPDADWVNLGTYRVMLVDRNHVALHMLAGQHGNIIMNQKYFARGRKMPVAIAIGLDPTLWFASFNHAVPWGTSEYDFAGAMKGQPVEIIKGEFTGLPIPARAEIVIEGEAIPGTLVDEGPFGEWNGYYANMGLKSVLEPLVEVKAVYYRKDPILSCQLPTMPYLDNSNLPIALGNSDGIWNRLEASGIPGIKGVWCFSEVAGDGLFVVVSTEQLYPGHSREVGLVASQYPHQGRYTIVVEDDVDPSNLEQVIWSICTRGKPDEAIEILHHCRSNSSDPTITPEEKLKYKTTPKPLHNARVIIDACRPLEWKNDWYPVVRMSTELREKIIRKWKDRI
jgi:UbiD family decarboxylase